MRERRVLWVVLAAFVVGLVAVAGVAAVDDSPGSGPPRLPALAAGGFAAAGAETAASDMAMRIGPVEYRVAGSLPSLPDRASAWDVGAEVGVDDVRRLASLVGVDGDVRADGDAGWRVFDGTRLLFVSRSAGAPWSLSTEAGCTPMVTVSPDGATARPADPELHEDGTCTDASSSASGAAAGSFGTVPANDVVECPGAPTCPPDADCVMAGCTEPAAPATTVEPCPMPECPPGAACIQMCPEPIPEPVPLPAPERPADLPSKADAERIGLAFLSDAGLDVDGADVRVDDGFSQWLVAAEPRVGGLPTQGLSWSASVGPRGEIQYANGWLADPTEGDAYPLAGVETGIERLKSGAGFGGWSPYPAVDGGPEPAIALDAPACDDCADPPGDPIVRTITDVRLGLLFSPVFTDDGISTEALLVPAYFFHFDDGDFEQPVVAVADAYLPPPPEPGGSAPPRG